MRISKTDQLKAHMARGDWSRALSLANTFRHLGPHRTAIRRAHECRVFPHFFVQLGHDPEALIAAGIQALKALYPERN
jgi:hypothetical protein